MSFNSKVVFFNYLPFEETFERNCSSVPPPESKHVFTPGIVNRTFGMQNLEGLEYLDRYGVTAYMKDVVTLLLENRPSQPIAFISKYFRTVTQGSSPLLRAYRYIRLAGPTQAAFIDNVVSAYVALDTRRGTSGVTGAELLRLLRPATPVRRLPSRRVTPTAATAQPHRERPDRLRGV